MPIGQRSHAFGVDAKGSALSLCLVEPSVEKSVRKVSVTGSVDQSGQMEAEMPSSVLQHVEAHPIHENLRELDETPEQFCGMETSKTEALTNARNSYKTFA